MQLYDKANSLTELSTDTAATRDALERLLRLRPALLASTAETYRGSIIARALAVPGARPYWDILKRLYQKEQHWQAKDGLACAVCAVAVCTSAFCCAI